MHRTFLRSLYFFATIVSPYFLQGQNAGLNIRVDPCNDWTVNCHDIIINKGADTILKTRFYISRLSDDSMYFHFEKKNLEPGAYEIRIRHSNSPAEHWYNKKVSLRDYQMAYQEIQESSSPYYLPIDTANGKIYDEHDSELEISMTGFNNLSFDPASDVSTVLSFGVTSYLWNSFSKHAGSMFGMGAGWAYYKVKPDSADLILNNSKITRHGYNYLYLNTDFKLRFSPSNQKELDKHNRLYLDAGLRYNLPLLFRLTSHYRNQKHKTEKRLHEFTDVRCFINLGFRRAFLFAEYRPFDFVLGHFSETTRYMAGLKLTFGTMN